jgi:TatD DNase family protein
MTGGPRLTDTHAHFDATMTPEELAALMERATAAGVWQVLAVGGAPGYNTAALRVAKEYPGRVRAAIGLDRHLATEATDVGDIARAIAGAPPGHVAAIGETGLDGHHSPETMEDQKRLMNAHLELASSLRLPVVIHTREADKATLELLGAHARQWPGDPLRIGVIHCYTGDGVFARQLLELGFLISFSGIVTFRNADPLRAVARDIPSDRLLIETDSPYLAPVPYRGRANEPAFLPATAAAIAAVRGVGVEEIASLTSANAARLFGWCESPSRESPCLVIQEKTP